MNHYPNTTDPREPWLTKSQLAAHTQLHIRTIERRMRDGLPHARFGRVPRFKASAVEAWFLANAEGAI